MSRKNVYSEAYVKIWDTVKRIPPGKVSTYGHIARIAGLGRHARLVGYALNSIPPGSDVPWHRVINARGQISLSKDTGAYQLQRKLLIDEGIRFSNETIDLSVFGWV